MPDMSRDFYLGRKADADGKIGDQPYFYDPDDLVTHAVIVGMTGSGKTGLGIGLLEEAARQGLPALVIDPKGDLTNELLHFPELRPEDFLPWIPAEEARRAGKPREALAREKAELWRKGLASFGLGPSEIEELGRVGYAVFTPGSSAGLPISILGSLKAPEDAADPEALADRVEATTSALLGLVGIEADPVQSREHILISRILLDAWERGGDLDLAALIQRVQAPPFDRVGVLDLESFFPQGERFKLAMALNNLLAAPGFALWTQGVPLDAEKLLFDEEGRPRHAVVYLAHLSEAERMFFLTLLLEALWDWARRQPGTERLRALLYFDEVFGYLPPTRKPPTKPVLLRLFKQARAFGVGLVLATQNPVDLDYKALSNAGTWFVGRLQTEQDKNRLLDGLESLTGELDRRTLDQLISGLKKRVFLAKNVHEAAPVLFGTRWVMNYLAGPLGKERIPELNALAGAKAPRPRPKESAEPRLKAPPPAPAGLEVYYLDQAPGRYQPGLFAEVEYRVRRPSKGLDQPGELRVWVPAEELSPPLAWAEFALEAAAIFESPPEDAEFAPLPAALTDRRRLRALERDLKDWIRQNRGVRLYKNPALKLYSQPSEDREAFLARAEKEARWRAEDEIEKLKKKYARRIRTLERRLERERRELAEDEAELNRRKLEEIGGYLETVLGFLGGRRRSVTGALSKRRMRARAADEVAESKAEIAALEEEIENLREELAAEVEAIEARWQELAENIEEETLLPYKKDIRVRALGVGWAPEG